MRRTASRRRPNSHVSGLSRPTRDSGRARASILHAADHRRFGGTVPRQAGLLSLGQEQFPTADCSCVVAEFPIGFSRQTLWSRRYDQCCVAVSPSPTTTLDRRLAVNFDANNTLGFGSSQTISANTYNITTNPAPLITGLGHDHSQPCPALRCPGKPGISTNATAGFPAADRRLA